MMREVQGLTIYPLDNSGATRVLTQFDRAHVDVRGGIWTDAVIGCNAPSKVDVGGGIWKDAVIRSKKTVVHIQGEDLAVARRDSSDLNAAASKTFKLSPDIIVYEKNPICPESRIYRAKLRSKVTGDRDIAVKLLPFGDREQREAKIHFLVPHHKNIVERIFIDTFSYRGQQTIYIAMECCDDQNMYDYVKSQSADRVPFDSKKYLNYAYQVANGLHFLHRHNIINRDLKPPNLLLAKNKTVVKIADFGLSKQIAPGRDDATLSKMYPGTVGWNAPEILRCAETITIFSDIFPLGLVLYFLWSHGKHPYGDDPDSWNHYIKRGKNCNLDHILIPNSDIAKSLLQSMLQTDPDKRPTTREILKHKIFQTLDEGSSSLENDAPEPAACPDTQYKPNWELPRKQIEMQALISQGRFNEVWKGRNGENDVVIKKRLAGSMSIERFFTMANVMMNLQHKNIVEFIGLVSRECLLVMEYMERGSLLNFLKTVDGQSTTQKDHIGMALDIASAMSYIEKKKYIHRNLRAANIMVGSNIVCKVGDFDSSRYVGDDGVYEPLTGGKFAIKWMAPEILSQFSFTIKSDVWSFGILLTEITTKGRVPYPGMSKEETRTKVSQGYQMPKPINCPTFLYDLMRQCWQKDSRERPSFNEIKNTLLRYRSHNGEV